MENSNLRIENTAPAARAPKITEDNLEIKDSLSTAKITKNHNTESNLFKRPRFLSSAFTKRLQLKPIITNKETNKEKVK